jgi:dTDP-4-dehydrorhamnose reductase
MRILITGGGGMLGSAMHEQLPRLGHEVIATDLVADEPWLQPLDVRDTAAVEAEIDRTQPGALFHLAAVTDLEWCETNPDDAAETNAYATGAIARLCAARGLPLVYVSTAGVFDGEKREPYDERDAPAPIMVYGRTKLAGEDAVRAENARYFIVRAGWMFGGGRKDHKFVYKIAAQVREGASQIHAVNDKFGTATYTQDFARNLDLLVATEAYGTYHMVCEGGCARYDIAREIARLMGRPTLPIVPVSSEFFEAEYFAPRPRSEMMVNRALRQIGLNRMRPWQGALRDYLETNELTGQKRHVLEALTLNKSTSPRS